MKKMDVVKLILGDKINHSPGHQVAEKFAPSNIALCKYWGKRDVELNLPLTSSLSIALGDKGTTTKLKLNGAPQDSIKLNGQVLNPDLPFSKKLINFLNLFRLDLQWHLDIDTQNNIPVAAGLASSASGFAALVMALNQLFAWELTSKELSILARLGSGSACRSIAQGFVEWQVGTRKDGMDSFAVPLENKWPHLCVGLLILNSKEKPISSRNAMQITVDTSPFMTLWPEKSQHDLTALKASINAHDFHSFGRIAEANAMAMHALMLSAWPPISYALPETVRAMQHIWHLRDSGLELYFTQDAGPNLKLLFLEKDRVEVQAQFPAIEILQPFKLN